MKKLTYLLLALLLPGCAATRLSDEAEKQIKSVAIVSLVPEMAHFEKIGLTVFNNERGEIDMGDQISSTIKFVATKRLAVARPAWNVKTVNYDRAALIKRLNASGMVMAYNEERIEKELADLARSNHLDALVVVSAYKPENSHGDGVGVLLRTTSLSSIGNAYVHSNVSLKIIGPSGNIVAVSSGQSPAVKRIDPSAYGIKYKLSDNFNPELIDRLRLDIAEHLAQTITQKFDRLGM